MIAEPVAFPSLHAQPLNIPGLLRAPEKFSGVVVIAHGSAGPDSRGPALAEALAGRGLASLEIDMWAPRGLKGGLDRPKSIPDTLPDVFGAFEYLSARTGIDPTRIGIAGFSWGGVLSMLTATSPYAEPWLGGRRFAAHAPFYPVCWAYNRVPGLEFQDFTGAPILLQCGARDAYDPPGAPEALRDETERKAPGLLRLIVHEGATHAFDRTEPDMTIRDPFAHGGKGGEVLFAANAAAAQAARSAAAEFFAAQFAR
jgi:dienelactone hydrolase